MSTHLEDHAIFYHWFSETHDVIIHYQEGRSIRHIRNCRFGFILSASEFDNGIILFIKRPYNPHESWERVTTPSNFSLNRRLAYWRETLPIILKNAALTHEKDFRQIVLLTACLNYNG